MTWLNLDSYIIYAMRRQENLPPFMNDTVTTIMADVMQPYRGTVGLETQVLVHQYSNNLINAYTPRLEAAPYQQNRSQIARARRVRWKSSRTGAAVSCETAVRPALATAQPIHLAWIGSAILDIVSPQTRQLCHHHKNTQGTKMHKARWEPDWEPTIIRTNIIADQAVGYTI